MVTLDVAAGVVLQRPEVQSKVDAWVRAFPRLWNSQLGGAVIMLTSLVGRHFFLPAAAAVRSRGADTKSGTAMKSKAASRCWMPSLLPGTTPK